MTITGNAVADSLIVAFVAAFVLMWLVAVVVRTFKAPVALYRIVEQERDELRRQCDDLRDQVPSLVIVGLREHTETAQGTGHKIRIYSLTVKNDGKTYNRDCLVKLTSLCSRDGKRMDAILPIGMRTQHQHEQHRVGGRFGLRAGEEKNVRIASLNESLSDSEIILCYESEGYPNGLPRDDVYKIRIDVYGAPDPPSARYRIEVIDGRLQIMDLERLT